MLEIPLLVLVIQIGFNAALDIRGYGINTLIPIARSANSAPTRRLADPEGYLLSRGSSASIEMPELEYDSFEDYSFRSYQPVLYPYQRRSDDLRHSTRSENDVSLETPPIGRINSNNYAETVQSSSSSSRRSYPNYRRPYSARGPANLGQGQTRKYNRNKNDDSSVEVSSLEREDPSREEADSLLSLIEKSFSRRGQNRKYYRKGNSLSVDASPIVKLDTDEHAVHSPNSQNRRRNYRKEYRNQYNLRVGGSKSRKLTNDSPLTQRFNRLSNGNSRSSLRDASFPDDDETGQLTFLRLSSLEDLNLESLLLRIQDQNGLYNRKRNSRNFLRLSLPPNNKLSLDEGIASDLSELLSEMLDELNLIPVSLRTGPSSNKYSRRENRLSAEEDDLINPSDLLLESLDITNSDVPILRYNEPAYRSRKNNLRNHGSNRAALKKLFDEDTANTLVPYHEGNREKLPNSRRNGNQNNNRIDDFSDEFSLDTLFDFKKEDYDDQLNLDDNLSSDLSVLPSTNQANFSLKSSFRSSDENESKPTTDKLNLEYHWIDVLSPKNKTKTKSLKSQKKLRNGEKKEKTKNSTEILKLEYPWTDVLSPCQNKTSGLQSLTQLRNDEQEDKSKDSSDPLHLEFPWDDGLSPGSNKSGKLNLRSPKQKENKKDATDVLHPEHSWNDQLSPDNNKSKQLRSHDQEDKVKDTTDVIHLEFPWNDELSPDENKTGKSKSLRRQTDSRQGKEPKDELKLELPWNGKTNLDKPSSKKTEPVRIPDPFYVHPYLRSKNIKKHPNYFTRSYDDFSEGVGLENHKNSPLKRSNRRFMNRINLRPIARQGSDSVSVERPSAVITFPSDRIHKRLRVRTRRPNNETPPLVTTTEIPNNTDS